MKAQNRNDTFKQTNCIYFYVYIESCVAIIALAVIACVSPEYRMLAIYVFGVNMVVHFTSFIIGLMYDCVDE